MKINADLYINKEILHKLKVYTTKGNKQARIRQVQRIMKFCRWCRENRKRKSIFEIGKKDIYLFYRQYKYKTALDYYYAICVLWQLLGHPKLPPKPQQ